MYIRFVVNVLDEDSNARLGIIQVAYDLKRDGHIPKYDEDILSDILNWFEKNLKEPISFRRSRKYHAQNKAISWFKPEATVHISKMHELKQVLERHDITVDIIKTERTGFIVYEDAFQIVAEPFSETST